MVRRIGRAVFLTLLLGVATVSATEITSEPLLLTGAVTDAAGNPLAGVQVAALVAEGEPPTTTTGEDGLFWIEAPAGTTLRFTLEGYLSKEETPQPEQESTSVALVLAASLRVLVTDELARPVPGAEVALLDGTDPAVHRRKTVRDLEAIFTDEADSRGIASFSGLSPGLYAIRVQAAGFHMGSAAGITLRPGQAGRQPVSLIPKFTLTFTGCVRDQEGQPIPGAQVARRTYHPPEQRWSIPADTPETDEAGRYRVQVSRSLPIPPPEHATVEFLTAAAPGHGPILVVMAAPWEDTVIKRDLVLPPAGEIRGRVLDEADRPVAGVEIEAEAKFEHADPRSGEVRRPEVGRVPALRSAPDPEGATRTKTDEKGRFRIQDVPGTTVRLRPRKEGYVPPREWTEMVVRAGHVRDGILLHWSEGATIEGVVVDEKGIPIRCASVTALDLSPLRTETDSEGWFRLGGLEADTARNVTVEAKGYGPETRRGLKAGADPVLIRLRPTGAVSGSVLSATTGNPVIAFAVILSPHTRGENPLGVRQSRVLAPEDGSFMLTGVPAGLYRVEIHAGGYLPEERERLEVRPGEEMALLPVSLEPGHEVSGLVVDRATSLPIEGARVHVKGIRGTVDPLPRPPPELGGARADHTDAEGRFRIRGLPAGEVILVAEHPARASGGTAVRLGDEEPDPTAQITLGEGAEVEVTLLDAEGQPADEDVDWHALPYVQVERLDPQLAALFGSSYRSAPARKGRVRFRSMPAGRYRFRAEHCAAAERVLDLRDGDRIAVTLKPEGTTLHGRLLYRGGAVQNARVWGNDAGWKRRIHCTIEGSRYRCQPFPEGTYTLIAIGDPPGTDKPPGDSRLLRLHQQVRVGPGEGRVEMDLVFPDRRLTGRVVREDSGAPVPEASVSLHLPGKGRMEGHVGSGSADAAGRFEIQLSHTGAMHLWAYATNDQSETFGWKTRQTITIPPGGSLEEIVVRIGPANIFLRGRVLGTDGNPLEGARTLFQRSGDFPADSSLPLRGPWTWGLPRSDIDGRFEYDGLSSGSWLVGVYHDRFAPLWVAGIQVDREPVDLGDLVLRPGGTLEVRLPAATTEDGEALRMHLSRPGLPYPILLAEDDLHRFTTGFQPGSYLLPHFPEGTWTIDLEGAGPPQRRIVEVRTKEMTVVDFSDGGEE